nr:MAG TPA: hypothetical protein [Caudoviricetes sp.]DAR76592.1 MAG TPA: hypothetical protein [Caudoviricetes sp.]DAV28864.1 MAG TPA: hypothetical protein [Caudoviricetes sp.]
MPDFLSLRKGTLNWKKVLKKSQRPRLEERMFHLLFVHLQL